MNCSAGKRSRGWVVEAGARQPMTLLKLDVLNLSVLKRELVDSLDLFRYRQDTKNGRRLLVSESARVNDSDLT
jgi:hypothetical protein